MLPSKKGNSSAGVNFVLLHVIMRTALCLLAASAIKMRETFVGLRGVLLATGDGKRKSAGGSCWP
jgi:hypothetical protein